MPRPEPPAKRHRYKPGKRERQERREQRAAAATAWTAWKAKQVYGGLEAPAPEVPWCRLILGTMSL